MDFFGDYPSDLLDISNEILRKLLSETGRRTEDSIVVGVRLIFYCFFYRHFKSVFSFNAVSSTKNQPNRMKVKIHLMMFNRSNRNKILHLNPLFLIIIRMELAKRAEKATTTVKS
jgi:hypothetical protein